MSKTQENPQENPQDGTCKRPDFCPIKCLYFNSPCLALLRILLIFDTPQSPFSGKSSGRIIRTSMTLKNKTCHLLFRRSWLIVLSNVTKKPTTMVLQQQDGPSTAGWGQRSEKLAPPRIMGQQHPPRLVRTKRQLLGSTIG